MTSRTRRRRPLTEEERRKVAFESRSMLYGFILHLLTQVNHISCPWHERWQRLFSIPFSASPWLWSAYSPESYYHYREISLFIFKLMWFSFPLLRKPRGIQKVMESTATLGLLGFPIDVIKMAWGTRMLALIWFTISQRQNIILYAMTQCYAVFILRSNDSLCKTRLMQDPVTQQRLRQFNRFSTGIVLPKTNLNFMWEQEQGDCAFFMTLLLTTVGATLPITLHYFYSTSLGKKSNGLVLWTGCLQIALASSIAATSVYMYQMGI